MTSWRNILFCSFATSLLGPVAFAADPPICPAKIDVHQQLAAPAPGWTPIFDGAPHVLAGVTFYDGPPQEKASLVYDSITRSPAKQTATWRLAPSTGRQTWISCSYSGTSVELAKSLPATATCEVTYDTRQQIAGLPTIEKIACK